MNRSHSGTVMCVALFLTAAPPEAYAQGVATSFEQLRVLVGPGDTLTVRDSSGLETSGKLDSLTPSSLTLLTSGRSREFREADVSRISQRRGDSLANGAWIGTGIGAASFALLAAQICSDEDCEAGGVMAGMGLYAAMGAGIGVGIDALVTRTRPIFEKPTGSVAVGVAPLMAGGRRGAVLLVAF